MQEFLRNQKVLRTFYAAADAATAPCGAPQANRNDFYFSATPEANSTTNQSCDYVQATVAAALRLRYDALSYGTLENAHNSGV